MRGALETAAKIGAVLALALTAGIVLALWIGGW